MMLTGNKKLHFFCWRCRCEPYNCQQNVQSLIFFLNFLYLKTIFLRLISEVIEDFAFKSHDTGLDFVFLKQYGFSDLLVINNGTFSYPYIICSNTQETLLTLYSIFRHCWTFIYKQQFHFMCT